MELNRNQYFLAGLVLLLLGVELRMVDSVVLTSEFTKFLATKSDHPVVAATNTVDALMGTDIKLPPKTVRPPDWLGWSLASIGSVLILHSLAMNKPGG
ncbi:MAG: hypothetical protein ABFD16_13115 [Thermoguttaceae bacterium]|jgi:hypothetical protein